MTTIGLVSLVNDDAQFAAARASLQRLVDPLPPWLVVKPNERGWNAAQGLNHGLEQLATDWVVCVHQDVLFPDDFWRRFAAALASLEPGVALAGLVGCEASGRYRGHIFDPNGHCYWPSLPHRVLTLDEVLIAVRRSSGLRFCEQVPGFHCYGADLCLEANRRGLGVVAVDAPLLHLSTGKIDVHYERASQWLMEKWGPSCGFVLPTPALLLKDDARAGAVRRLLQRWRRRGDRLKRNTNRCPEAACAVRALGRAQGVGPHAAATSAAGTPVAGTPGAGTSVAGTSAVGTSGAGTPAAGTSAAGTSAAGTSAAGTSAVGTSGAGTPAAGTPGAGPKDA